MTDVLMVFISQAGDLLNNLSQKLNAYGISTKQITISDLNNPSNHEFVSGELLDAKIALYIHYSSPPNSANDTVSAITKFASSFFSPYLIVDYSKVSSENGEHTHNNVSATPIKNAPEIIYLHENSSLDILIRWCLHRLKKYTPKFLTGATPPIDKVTEVTLRKIFESDAPITDYFLWADSAELQIEGAKQNFLLIWTTSGLSFVDERDVEAIISRKEAINVKKLVQIWMDKADDLVSVSLLSIPYSAIFELALEADRDTTSTIMRITFAEADANQDKSAIYNDYLKELLRSPVTVETEKITDDGNDDIFMLKLKVFLSSERLKTIRQLTNFFNSFFESRLILDAILTIVEASSDLQVKMMEKRLFTPITNEGIVFLSYARQDYTFVSDLNQILSDQFKFQVWMDVQQIRMSQGWWEAIEAGIKSASYFVLIISPWSITSPVVLAELTTAIKYKKRIIGVRLQNVPDHLIPLQFSRIPFLPVDAWEGNLRETAKRLSELISRINQSEEVTPKTLKEIFVSYSQALMPPSIKREIQWLGFGIVLSIASAVVLLVWLFLVQMQRLPSNITTVPIFFWIQFPILLSTLIVLPVGYLWARNGVPQRRFRTVILVGFTFLALLPAVASGIYLVIDIFQLLGVQIRSSGAAILDSRSSIPFIVALMSGVAFLIAVYNAGWMNLWLLADPNRLLEDAPVEPLDTKSQMQKAIGFTNGITVETVNIVFADSDREAAIQIARRLSRSGMQVSLNNSTEFHPSIGLIPLISAQETDDYTVSNLKACIQHAIDAQQPILPVLLDQKFPADIDPKLGSLNFLRLNTFNDIEDRLDKIFALLQGNNSTNEIELSAPGNGILSILPTEISVYMFVAAMVCMVYLYEFMNNNIDNAQVFFTPDFREAGGIVQWFNYLAANGLYLGALLLQIVVAIGIGRRALRYRHIAFIQCFILVLILLVGGIQFLGVNVQGRIEYIPGSQLRTQVIFFDLFILLVMIYLIDNHWWLPLKTQWRKLGWVFALFGVVVIAVVTALFLLRLSSIA